MRIDIPSFRASSGRLLFAGRQSLRKCRGAALDLLFPATCAACGAEMESSAGRSLCSDCLNRLKLFEGPTCRRCGAAAARRASSDGCYSCRGIRLWFHEAVALGSYQGLLREWLLYMKDDRSEPIAFALADLIWQRNESRLAAMRPDVVVPVPTHWRRRWTRGSDAAVLLAERLADRMRLPLAAGLLRRKRNTPPQFSLPPSQRRANVRRAFAIRAGYYLEQARVLLVDDILTTGSTCSATARVLRQRGAAYVGVAVVGRAGRY